MPENIRQKNLLVLSENKCFLSEYGRPPILGCNKPVPPQWGQNRHTVWIEEFSNPLRFWLKSHSIKFLIENKVRTLVYKKKRIS